MPAAFFAFLTASLLACPSDLPAMIDSPAKGWQVNVW